MHNQIKRGDLVHWVTVRGRVLNLRGIVLEEVELPAPAPLTDPDPALRVLWFKNNQVLTRLRCYHTKVEVESD